ncbi:MAG: DNA translocase FtsK 4TM domain-containing protein [Zhaonellaceae bacterium]|jgi:S-DNA-T family DNA segregation ATPase FtsK/SpoIIIE|nr:DNA translocase FtsK [Clostridia bacterium]
MGKAVKERNTEMRYEIIGLILLAFAILCFICLITVDYKIYPQINEAIGPIGNFLVRTISGLFGKGKYLFCLLLAVKAIFLLRNKNHPFNTQSLGILISYGSLLAFFHMKYLVLENIKTIIITSLDGLGGGLLGATFAIVLNAGFGQVGSYIILITVFLVGILFMTGNSFTSLASSLWLKIKELYKNIKSKVIDFLFVTIEEDEVPKGKAKKAAAVIIKNSPQKDEGVVESDSELPLIIHGEGNNKKSSNLSQPIIWTEKKTDQAEQGNNIEKVRVTEVKERVEQSEYVLPSLSLLQKPARSKNLISSKDIAQTVKLLEETLESFGVNVKVTEVSCGPAITRYEAQPAPGVKVSKIVNLADDIALSLAASHVRIEAPIPGKAAVGIEVPNREIATVRFREVLEGPEFQNTESLLTIALGKDIAGQNIFADLGKMPHLLIAGATGSGKSVCMNSLICSLLFKCKPNELKFLMVDPKMVELTTFNGIPHLLAPVVTDAKKSATALRWMVNEMENRYALFAASGVKDIERYNKFKQQEDPTASVPALPYIVILIDELADLMMVAPADVEDAICRLAQMARAAGIHLVVATQRPSVDVITGVIKANIPSRIAFAVSSQTDSRTILDMGGAEKLLGRGDMLFYPVGMNKPIRVQGAYVSDKEVDDIVSFWRKQGEPEYMQGAEVLEASSDTTVENNYEEDELLPEAVRLLIENGQASISMLQRRLRIGYTRAARLIDIMEDRGIVGSFEGSKPRAVLMTWEEYEKMFGQL